ncbi:MAG TPA: hypothetical protein VIK77_03735 [Tissierellaceae bacterium]
MSTRQTLLTEEEANTIIAMEKVIVDDIIWKRMDEKACFEFNVPVLLDYPGKLVLIGTKSFFREKYSFTLLYNNEFRIRGLDVGKGHRNPPDKKQVGKKHKHKWTDLYKDKWAYVPNDITDGAKVTQALFEFFKECNIIYKGKAIEYPSYQYSIDDLT